MTDGDDAPPPGPPGPVGDVVAELRRHGRVLVREHVASPGADARAKDAAAVDSRESADAVRDRTLVLEWIPDEESDPDALVIVDVAVLVRAKAGVESRAVASPASATVSVTALDRTERLELAIDAASAPGTRSSSERSRTFTATASDELSRARRVSRPFTLAAHLQATSSADAHATAGFDATWSVSASLSRR